MKNSNFIYAILIVILLLISQKGQSCINEYRALLNGKIVFKDALNAIPSARFNIKDKVNLRKKLQEADSIYKLTGKVEDLSDMGVMLVYNGQYDKAKQLFQYVENLSPGLYQTAANLGTTYELLGENDSALYWIKRAVKINANSHGGSEWIHIRILESKIKANGNENYLTNHNILLIDFGNSEIPENKNKVDLQILRDHLYRQLNERMTFIQPKDPIIAQLLFDLGNILALTIDVKTALQLFEIAKKYGYKSDLLNKRELYFMKLQSKADLRNSIENLAKKYPLFTLLIIAFGLTAFIAGIVILYKRIKRKKTNPKI